MKTSIGYNNSNFKNIFLTLKSLCTMKNLVMLFALCVGFLFANQTFAQNSQQKQASGNNKQTKSAAELIFTDGEVTVYSYATPGKPNVYYAVNQIGENISLNFWDDGEGEISPTPVTTAKKAKPTTGTTPPVNDRKLCPLKCKCTQRSPIGLCQNYECTRCGVKW